MTFGTTTHLWFPSLPVLPGYCECEGDSSGLCKGGLAESLRRLEAQVGAHLAAFRRQCYVHFSRTICVLECTASCLQMVANCGGTQVAAASAPAVDASAGWDPSLPASKQMPPSLFRHGAGAAEVGPGVASDNLSIRSE